MYAITPKGIGQPVGWRRINWDTPLLQSETFVTHTYPAGKVLAEDEASLRDPSDAELFERVKDAKRDEINAARDAALDAGFVFDGNTYDSDAKSIQRITGAAVLATLDPALALDWVTKDNGVVSLTAAQLVELGQTAAAHEQAHIFKARQLKDAVDAATTEGEIDAITW